MCQRNCFHPKKSGDPFSYKSPVDQEWGNCIKVSDGTTEEIFQVLT